MGDFGLSRRTEEGYYTTENRTLPVKWCSPEVLQYGKFSSKVNTQNDYNDLTDRTKGWYVYFLFPYESNIHMNRAMCGHLGCCCGNYLVMELVHTLRYLTKKCWIKYWKDIECKTQKVVIYPFHINIHLHLHNTTLFVGCPDEVYQLMAICWNTKPQDRPTFKTLSDKIQSLVQDGKQQQASAFGN